MKSLTLTFSLYFLFLLSCNDADTSAGNPSDQTRVEKLSIPGKASGINRKFSGVISNGMKGDSIFFEISADGKRLENLVFKGYWRCSGRLEQIIAGPDGGFVIRDGKVNDHISEPPDGGSTAWRFDLNADINEKEAWGDFRMNINNLGCDTYKLKWTASAQ